MANYPLEQIMYGEKYNIKSDAFVEVSKFSSVEQTTYDRAEATAKNQVYPIICDKVVGDISSTDIQSPYE